MADSIIFTEGWDYLLTHGNGLPTTCYWLLSTNAVADFTAASTLAGGVGEITGTGYARKSEAAPTPSAGSVAFSQFTWSTGAATDWPATVKSAVLVTSSDNTGKAICAINLVTGGTARDMSAANTTENFTPTLS